MKKRAKKDKPVCAKPPCETPTTGDTQPLAPLPKMPQAERPKAAAAPAPPTELPIAPSTEPAQAAAAPTVAEWARFLAAKVDKWCEADGHPPRVHIDPGKAFYLNAYSISAAIGSDLDDFVFRLRYENRGAVADDLERAYKRLFEEARDYDRLLRGPPTDYEERELARQSLAGTAYHLSERLVWFAEYEDMNAVNVGVAPPPERKGAEETVSTQELLDDRALLVGALLEHHRRGQGTKRFVREAATAESLAKTLGWTLERVREIFVLLPGDSYEAYRQECERGAAHRCLSRFSRLRARHGKALTPTKWSVFWMTRAVTVLGLAKESLADIHKLLVTRSVTNLSNYGTFKKAVQRAAFRKNDKGEWERRCQSSSAAGPSLVQKEPAARQSLSALARPPARPATKGAVSAPKVCASCKDDFEPHECPECGKMITDCCLDCHAEKAHGKLIPPDYR